LLGARVVDLSGQTLRGKYKIEGLLGSGGMGSVWKGTHVITRRKVAIKVLDERFLSQPVVLERFGREARAASAIQHGGIVEVLDLDQTEEGVPFLVMEFLEGESLSQRVERKGRLSQEETLQIGVQILEALAAAHRHGVIHRDLKPDNIFLVPAGGRGDRVKILDFGISHKEDEAHAKLTVTGSVLGTPHYMSPEQAMGEAELDRRVDIYAVGVVLYECLVGQVPFDAPNYNKLLRVILDEEPVPPSRRGAVVDPEFERIVLSAMAKQREKRPQTAEEMLERLRALLEGKSGYAERGEPERGSESVRRIASGSGVRLAEPAPPVRAAPDTVQSARGKRDASSQTSPAPVGELPWRDPFGDLEPIVASTPSPALAPLGEWPTAGGTKPSATASAPAPPFGTSTRPAAPAASPGVAALDPFDPLAMSDSVAVELDETALARSSTARSGRLSRASGPLGGVAEPGRASPHAAGTPSPRGPSKAAPTPSDAPADAPAPARTSVFSTAFGTVVGWFAVVKANWNRQPEPFRRWTSRAALGFGAFVMVVVLLRALVGRPSEDSGRGIATEASVPSAAPTGVNSRPSFVLVHVDGVPPNAQIRLDGVPGALLPLRLRQGTRHVLDIRAAGYEDRRLEFTAEPGLRLRADMRPNVGTFELRPR
jgi:serine/threonine-protein kinase